MTFRPLPSTLLLTGLLPFAAYAQSAPAQDPMLVATRRVEPRIAYHALAPTENPVAAQAPVFTARAFGMAMGSVGDGVAIGSVDDDVLGALEAGGLDRRLAPTITGALGTGLGLGTGPAGRGGAPVGMTSALGSVGRVTSGVGGLVNRTLAQALGGHP